MKRIKEIFEDERGISAMQDAILFCIMVSIAGVILLPAFTSNIPKETHIEKEGEEKTNEVLHQLMTCTVNEFAHLNAKTVMDDLGIQTDGGLLKPVLDSLLNKEQLHRSYADLCTECIACQFKLENHRLNILTEDFTNVLKIQLGKFLDEQLGNDYKYNFTVIWNPIVGFDFGGEVSIGGEIPERTNIYASHAYVTMPPSLFTNEIGFSYEAIRNNIYENLNFESSLLTHDEGFEQMVKEKVTETANRIICEGFEDGTKSIVDTVVDYIFSKIENTIYDIFGEAFSMATDMINTAGGNEFDVLIEDCLKNSFGQILSSDDTTLQTLEWFENALKDEVREEAEKFISDIFNRKVEKIVEYMFDNGITDLQTKLADWLLHQINFCRAEMCLAIWEV